MRGPHTAATRAKISATKMGTKASLEHRAKISAAGLGRFKPTASKYAIHSFLRRTFPKIGVCEHCGTNVGTTFPKGTQFSFNHHPEPHTRLREDYEELCKSCHVTKDMAMRVAA